VRKYYPVLDARARLRASAPLLIQACASKLSVYLLTFAFDLKQKVLGASRPVPSGIGDGTIQTWQEMSSGLRTGLLPKPSLACVHALRAVGGRCPLCRQPRAGHAKAWRGYHFAIVWLYAVQTHAGKRGRLWKGALAWTTNTNI